MDSIFRRAAMGSYGLALGFGVAAAVTNNLAMHMAALLSAVLAVALTLRYGLPS